MTETYSDEAIDLDLLRDTADALLAHPTLIPVEAAGARPDISTHALRGFTAAISLLRDIRTRTAPDVDLQSLGVRRWIYFARQLESALQLIDLCDMLRVEGLVVIYASENPLEASALFDFTNYRALSLLGDRRSKPFGLVNPSLRTDIETLSKIDSRVQIVSREQGIRSFLHLFSDAFGRIARASHANQSYAPFTLLSQNRGYQVEFWPQYNCSPLVLGSTLTYPVTDYIAFDYYHFQGHRPSHATVLDTRVHLGGPGRTATVTAF
jgi:hypothetical protein